MKEWKQIPGFEGFYSVSNDCEVRRDAPSVHTGGTSYIGKILKNRLGAAYLYVCLFKNGIGRNYFVHVLMMMSFNGPAPIGYEINHKDGNKHNNVLSNLEYVTKKQNMQHALKNGLMKLGEMHGRAKLTNEQVMEIRQRYAPKLISMHKLSKEYGVAKSTIRCVVTNRFWKHVKTGV